MKFPSITRCSAEFLWLNNILMNFHLPCLLYTIICVKNDKNWQELTRNDKKWQELARIDMNGHALMTEYKILTRSILMVYIRKSCENWKSLYERLIFIAQCAKIFTKRVEFHHAIKSKTEKKYQYLSILVNSCQFLSILVNFCQFLSILNLTSEKLGKC